MNFHTMLYLLTIFSTSTIYPTATPAPAYRRHARDLPLQQRASWCDDKPCRLVQYDDDTILEACKKYLGWGPSASTVSVPGYTVTITSYPTDCKKKDDGYKPAPAPTETPEGEYEPAYPEDEPAYDAPAPWEDTGADDAQHSDDLQPWENAFDNNYDGPDGPKPWDDVGATSELASAIEAGGYDAAAAQLGLDDDPSTKRDVPAVEGEVVSEPEDTTDSSSLDSPPDDGSVWVLPESSEYGGDDFEADYYADAGAPEFGADAETPEYMQEWVGDGVY